jgi:hypothetical protein
MPVQPTYPGVYVQEIPSGVVAISAVATSIALFIGRTQRGPLDTPKLVLNRTSYETQFGTDTVISEMTDQVRQFFLNGGNQAYIMRIANSPLTAAVAVSGELGGAPVVTFQAAGPGKIGETIRIVVDYNTSRPETTFNLTAYRETAGAGGQIQQVETETYKELSVDPNSGLYVVDVLAQQSNLINATVPAGLPSIQGFTFGGMLGTTAADLNTRIVAAINAAIAKAGPGAQFGRFDISVDEQPFVTVSLLPGITGAADIQTQINAALTPLNLQVAVNALQVNTAPNLFALQILSQQPASPTSSVRVRRASTPDDIAAAVQLSSEDGAIEVGGGVFLRPMANGIVARPFSNVPDISPLATLLGSAPAAVTGLTLTDSAAINVPFAFSAQAVNTLLDDATVGQHSFASGRDNLDAMVQQLNARFAAVLPQRWSASRSGYRIVLKSTLSVADLGPATTMAPFGGGTYPFGAANSYLPAVGTAGPQASEANVAAYRPAAYASSTSFPYATGTQAGTDGGKPVLADYNTAFDFVRREVDLFNLMVLPRDQLQNDADRSGLWGPASAFCQQRRAVLLVDPSSQWTDIDKAKAGVIATRIGVIKDYAAIYWPRITIVDPATGAQRPIDPAGSVAGICARIDASRGV